MKVHRFANIVSQNLNEHAQFLAGAQDPQEARITRAECELVKMIVRDIIMADGGKVASEVLGKYDRDLKNLCMA